MASKLHKVLAWCVGGWLALISLSGTLLLYKTEFLHWQYPVLLAQTDIELVNAELIDKLSKQNQYQTIMLPLQGERYVMAVNEVGDIDYWDLDGNQVLKRPINKDFTSILESFHVNLLLKDSGHALLNIIAVFSLLLLLTGVIRWWPKHWSRRLFKVSFSLSPKSFRQWHTVVAIVFSLFLFIPVLTSIGILNKQLTITALTFLSSVIEGKFEEKFENRPDDIELGSSDSDSSVSDSSASIASPWHIYVELGQRLFPDAKLSRVYFPKDVNDKVILRYKKTNEWHQYGRNFVHISPQTMRITSRKTTEENTLGLTWYERLYPIHTAHVGGKLLLVIMTILGVVPLILFVTGASYHALLADKKRR